jgi:transketolase
MLDAYDRYPSAVFLSGDLGFMALERVIEKYGARFINAGVAEQNMISVAAGLAYEGFVPWVYSIAPFAILRPYEQIRNDVCLHNLPVKIVGNGGGFGYGIMGATHHTLEDVGVMRVLPNMKVYVPLTSLDVADAVHAMAVDPSPNYLRLNLPVKFEWQLPRFQQWRKIKDGKSAVMISTGPIVGNMLEMKDAGEFEIWSVGVLPVYSFPAELRASVLEKRKVITLEEHRGQCGLNETIAHLILQHVHRAISFDALFVEGYVSGKYGSQRWHQEENGLAGERLAARLRAFLESSV